MKLAHKKTNLFEANNIYGNNLLQLQASPEHSHLKGTESNRSFREISFNWPEVHGSRFGINRCAQFQLSSPLTALIFQARLQLLRMYPVDRESGVFAEPTGKGEILLL